jgi:tocopherol cyclase
MPGLALTTVGARRGLLGVPGLEEDVGLVGITLPGGRFIELTPWTGDVEWSADEWGRWWLRAVGQGYEAVIEATAAPEAGRVLRCAAGARRGAGWTGVARAAAV